MTPDEQREYFRTIQRMPTEELKRRIANEQFLIEKWERWNALITSALEDPDLYRIKLKENVANVQDAKERKAILFVKFKELL